MSYQPPEQKPGESNAEWATRVLNDTSHHIAITDENIHEWLLLDKYRNKPWVLLTPRGQYKSDRLHERWIVPQRDEDGHVTAHNDVFWLNKILWHNDEDGWVAEYVEKS